jgi:hypothetical protein
MLGGNPAADDERGAGCFGMRVAPLQRLTPAELAAQTQSDDECADFEAFVKVCVGVCVRERERASCVHVCRCECVRESVCFFVVRVCLYACMSRGSVWLCGCGGRVQEDRNEIDDFVDVAVEEKEFMHLWNVFVYRHPIYCDSYTGIAAEAFTRQVRASPFARHLVRLGATKLVGNSRARIRRASANGENSG